MPKFNMSHQSKLKPKEAFNKICKIIEEEEQLAKLDPDYKCNFDKKNLCGDAKSKYFKADLNVSENDKGSLVEIIIDLPLKFALAKGVITKRLKAKMESVL